VTHTDRRGGVTPSARNSVHIGAADAAAFNLDLRTLRLIGGEDWETRTHVNVMITELLGFEL
jgi:hypothetical protein